MTDYMDKQQAAKEWGLSPSYVKRLCNTDRVPGAIKKGVQWWIPIGTPRPERLQPGPQEGALYSKRLSLAEIESIESMLRAGGTSLSEIGRKHGVTRQRVFYIREKMCK